MTAAASDWQRLSPHPQPGSVDDAINTSAHNIVETVKDTAAKKAPITPDNRGLAYGDGFFSTIAVIDGAIVWQAYHYQRLISHAQALQLTLDSQKLMVILQAHAQKLQQGMMKVVVTRVAQSVRGYGFTPDVAGSGCEVWLKSVAMPIDTAMKAQLPDGRTLLMQPMMSATCLTAQLSCLPPPLSGLKSLNRLDSVLASGELQQVKATKPNIDEGLVRDMRGYWVEGTMSNAFYQLSSQFSELPVADKSQSQAGMADSDNRATDYPLSGQWYTPPLTQSGVTGVQRQVIIDAFANTETPVIMRSLSDEDLPNLRGLFFCNALRGVMPVSELTLLSGQVVEFN
ncbi:aminotransferase class IV [Psychrobacter sp. H8-1]|uniref:aminotransferase class IV n=1 Tax=Psychrobacter sp. H8-1 TaxID=2774129 RepID=UPI001918946D|nr:aminotransferase class IV [Psychrobacter sp. H8-1]